ncbi:MAG: DUF1641 domain-containing protein [Desulfobaccales bacterium]
MPDKKLSTEQMLLERLDRMEGQLQTLIKAQQGLTELKNDLAPLVNSAVKIFIDELGMVEAGFQMEDFIALLKRGLRSIRNLTQALEMMENFFDLWNAMEPMLKSTVPNLIKYLDSLEQKGVFRTYSAMLEIRAKVAQHYPSEEISAMGDSFVVLLSLLRKLSQPEMIDFFNKMMEIPMGLNLQAVKPVGAMGMLSAMGNKETRQGLGVALELTKALGKLKAD